MSALNTLDRSLVLPQQRLSEVQVDEIVEAFQGGTRAKQLAVVYGASRQTIANHLRRRGVPTVNRLTEDEVEQAIRLYGQGWSLARVGDRFGREHTVIRDALERAGVPRRDTHRRAK